MDPEDLYDRYLWDEKTGAPLGVRPPRADDPAYFTSTARLDAEGSEDTFGDTSRYFLDRSRRDMADALRALSQAEGWGERLLRGVSIPLIGIEGLGAQGLAALSEILPHSVTHPHLSPDQAEREFVETFLYEVPASMEGHAAGLPGRLAQTGHKLRRAAGDFTDQYPSDELGYFHSAYAPTRAHMEQMAQPGYQLNPAEISYLNRVNEANRLRDEGLTNREIFEQTRIMLVPQRDASGNIVEEVALTATPRPRAYPTQVAPDARSRALGAELRGSEEEVRDLIDFGPDVEGLYPGGGPRANVRFERFSDPGVGGEHSAGTIYVSNRSRHLDRFIPIIAHEGEHDVQDFSGLLPDARGTSDDLLPGNPAERFAAYEANLGEMLARRAMGDDTTSVAAGIMQALNPFLRTGVHLPDLRRRELLPRFTVSVPANIFEANRNVNPLTGDLLTSDPWDDPWVFDLEP
jgi:hypothetical protein